MDSIEELYQYLEENAADCDVPFIPFQLARTIGRFLDQHRSSLEQDQISNLDCEAKAFLRDSLEKRSDGDPDSLLFTPAEYQYLKTRVHGSRNPYLIARYSHILLLSNEKNKHEYVPNAVDSYLSLVDFYREIHDKNGKNKTASILWALKNAMTIAMGFKNPEKQTDVKNNFLNLISKAPSDDPFYSSMIASLLEIMLDQNKLFLTSDFEGFDDICKKHADLLRRSDGMFANSAIKLYFIGEKIERKMGTQKNDWISMIAETYEELTNKFEKNPDVALGHCQNSIKYFKKANNDSKVKEMERKFLEIRPQIKINGHSLTIENEEYKEDMERYEAEVQRVLNESPEYILEYLANSANLILNNDDVKEGAAILDQSASSQIIGSGKVFDDAGNPAKVYETPEEMSRHNFMIMYSSLLVNYPYKLLKAIIIEGIKRGKITKETVMEYLNKTWIGRPTPFHTIDGAEAEKDWKLFIEPAISLFLSDMEKGIKDGKAPNFILPIDSLTLKFEGMMRNFCELNGISPVKHNTQAKYPIAEEKNLNDLLFDEQISSFIEDDELIFYRFLFVEKDGYNLRNNVAHSLLRYEQYNLFCMLLVFLSIMRLTKFRIVEK